MMRKNKQDWLETGMMILGQAGINGLTIERMTMEMGVTKGSFYHHFKNAQVFEEQLIAYWANQYLSTSAETPGSSVELLALLDTIMEGTFGSITEPEVAIRFWAYRDENVRSHVEGVDAVRLGFVRKVFRSMVRDETQAQMMADMLFAMMIGSIMALPRIPSGRVLDMYKEFKRLYRLDG
ncbi:MAG: TetR/AcrR family transcriptional regulator [Anaerolineaceae bacterium]|nr:TetR/AcrR family transcriptional regulator [Anaerolineaceae bacterium]